MRLAKQRVLLLAASVTHDTRGELGPADIHCELMLRHHNARRSGVTADRLTFEPLPAVPVL